jgi:hypothetical protein
LGLAKLDKVKKSKTRAVNAGAPYFYIAPHDYIGALMSQMLLHVLIAVAFAALCFGCGYLTAFIVTRNCWRDQMIERGIAHYILRRLQEISRALAAF